MYLSYYCNVGGNFTHPNDIVRLSLAIFRSTPENRLSNSNMPLTPLGPASGVRKYDFNKRQSLLKMYLVGFVENPGA